MEDQQNVAKKLKSRTKLNARKRTYYQFRTPSVNTYLGCEIRQHLPILFSEHITNVIDVLGDGHCGFRVVGQALGKGPDWAQVRKDLYTELENYKSLYDEMFGDIRRTQLLQSLDCKETPTPVEKWMTLPDMGLIIASCYNVAVVELSNDQCFTFLPLHSVPPPMPKLICVGFINGNHFVLVGLSENCPLPQIFSPWSRFHEQNADTWASLYM
ncbi:hypothetical protein KSP39_PZI018989 [Platanthera zijinensis]|uniref:OTU domain-containing protein n=1 Tax=Platanthera zijinensis TaxID=2320716 RepID=A0AAP0B355_9ASPA